MSRLIDLQATKIARAAHARGVAYLNSLFGLVPEHGDDGNLLPPPPNTLRVLLNQAATLERPLAGHGAKSQKRRSKRRRLRRRERFLQRQTWRAFHEEEKRRGQQS